MKIKTNKSASSIVGDYPTNQSILVNGTMNLTGARLQPNRLAESVIATGNAFSKGPDPMVSQINNQSGMGYSTMNPQVKNTINIDWAFKLTNFINGKHLSKKAK